MTLTGFKVDRKVVDKKKTAHDHYLFTLSKKYRDQVIEAQKTGNTDIIGTIKATTRSRSSRKSSLKVSNKRGEDSDDESESQQESDITDIEMNKDIDPMGQGQHE